MSVGKLKIRRRQLSRAEKAFAEEVAKECYDLAGGDVSIAKAMFNRHPKILALDIGTVMLMFQIAKLLYELWTKNR